MRPVNLIPADERLDHRRPMRSGPTAYIIVGALVAALIALTALVVTGNRVDDLKHEIAETEAAVSATTAKAQKLAAYTQFRAVRERRVATITSLADSRFDWERVMRELALILPDDVWLTDLTASANPGVSPGGGSSVELRGSIPGPALTLNGCARGQKGVAGFIQALKDIDGVTRVGVQGSSVGSDDAATDSGGSSTCQTRNFIAQFQIAVAFDAAPVAATTAESGSAPAPAPESEVAETASDEPEAEE